ncbi:MAG: hypothetical protein LBS30_05570, partial [Planctomycetota bacterium]|nr:hypothetical protein [Planctomycetota bacterium]
ILAELVGLTRVYRQATFQATLDAARNPEGEIDIRAIAPGALPSHGIDRVIRKATQPDIDLRYHHAGELSADIARLIEEQLPPSSIKRSIRAPDEEEESGPEPEAAGEERSRSGWFWMGALAVMAIEAAAALAWWLLR